MNVGCYIYLPMIAITICAILYIFKLLCANRGKKRGKGHCFSIVDSMKSKNTCAQILALLCPNCVILNYLLLFENLIPQL